MKEIKQTDSTSIGQRLFLIMSILLMVLSVCLFTGCSGSSGSDDDSGGETSGDTTTSDTTTTDTADPVEEVDVSTLDNDYDAGDYTWDSSEEVQITLSGTSISVNKGDAVVSGSDVTIVSAGTYRISGTLNDGRIIVDTEDEAVVRLIFDGIDVTCADSAPFYVANAERTAIILADGTSNVLADGYTSSWVFDDEEGEEPNATLHSKDYLTIGGSGSLTVNANYNDGITGKDGLVINSGTITVSAPEDGIRGKDYLIVKDGTLNVTTSATGDGLLSDNEEDTERGYILIEKGTVNINAREDAIQAETYVVVYDGVFNLTSGGGAGTSFSEEDSKKGIKGVVGVQIDGGDFAIDSADDAVHSNSYIVVNDGSFDIATGDDGMHADASLEIYGGDFSITESYEGIESSLITIDAGNFYIVSSDDGLNVAGGNDGSGMDGPGGGFTPVDTSDYYLYIDGGYIAVYAQGDGLDSNGSIRMTGGTVIIHGPTGDWNGILDSGDMGGTILIDGGFLVGAGSSGMPEEPDASSGLNFKMLKFGAKTEKTLCHIESSGGTELVTFKPAKEYESILICSPYLETGTDYNVYFGGSSTGTETDGLYEGGVYSGGTQDASLSFSLSL